VGYQKRREYYQIHEKKRQKPLIAYVTSIRPNMPSQMSSDAITTIIEQINRVPKDKKEIDFLIISNGGDPIAALRIITMLRERFDRISVIVPYVAFSAATILALGADEIIMHPYSNLGPIDPQMSILKQNEQGQSAPMQFSSEDIRNYIEFIRSDVGVTDQAQLTTAFSSLVSEVGPIRIGSAKRNQQLSLSLSEKMLETHMEDKEKAAEIAKALNTSFYHHGYAVSRREAKDIGLNVVFPDKELEDLIWSIWLDFSNEMKCNQVFDPISEIMNDSTAKKAISEVPVVTIPANTPPGVGQNIIAQIAQRSAQIGPQAPIDLVHPMAAIESVQRAYVFNNFINIVYWRDPNMALSFNMTLYAKGWEWKQV